MSPLVLPPLARADLRRWGVVGVVALVLLAGAAWRLAGTGPWLLAVPAALALLLVWVDARRVHVDPGVGSLTETRLGLRRTVRLTDAEWLHLADVGGGCMALLVMPARGSALRVGIVVAGRWADDSRRPATLRALADALRRHARTEDPLAEVLELQARHLEHGGDVVDSPLASIVLRPGGRRRSGEGSSSALARLLE